jgi:2-methylisocitrate lyase-like PEP mutase family enzyme
MSLDIEDLAAKAEVLRALHRRPGGFVLPNAWDVASARVIASAGFPAVGTSSGAVAQSLGYDDDDSMPVDDAFAVIARVARAVSVPVTADIEAGYGLSAHDLVGFSTLARSATTSKTPITTGQGR